MHHERPLVDNPMLRRFLGVLSVLPACLVLLAGLGACAVATRGASPKLALVMGNASYENAPALGNPVNDANDMCAALRRLGFKTLCHTNLRDRAEFDSRVKDYVGQLGPNSVGVVYYSGHGVQAGTSNFLIPTQANITAATADPLRVLYGVDDMFEQLRRQPTRFQLVILDACRTDLFKPAAPRPASAPAISPGRSVLIRALETSANTSSGLAPIKDAPPSTVVLYATAARDTTFDGDGRNGPLTKHILAHIGTKGLLLEEFFKRVTAGVETETATGYGKRTTPFTYGSFSGKFCFAGCPGEADVPMPF